MWLLFFTNFKLSTVISWTWSKETTDQSSFFEWYDSSLILVFFFFFRWWIFYHDLCITEQHLFTVQQTHSSAYWVWLFSARFWRCQTIPNFCCIKNIHYYYLAARWVECKWRYLQSIFASFFVRLSRSTIWRACLLPASEGLSGK